MAKNDDLTALFKAFMESRTDTAEDKDELKLRIKDLDRTLKEITQFFKTQGLYSKELGAVLKQAIEVEKQEVKRKKGSGQGLPRMVSDMHLDSIIKRAIEGSLKGSIGVFDTKSQNKLLQDSIKTIKDNQNAYEKLSNSLTGLQKSVADLGGKLAALMGTSGGAKDPAGGSGLGSLAAAALGKDRNKKDPDLKSAIPKGNGFMKGVSTLIGFLGNKSSSGFLGKLKDTIGDFAGGVANDVFKLGLYSLMSLAYNLGGKKGVQSLTIKGGIPTVGTLAGASSGVAKGVASGVKAGAKVSGKSGLKAGTKAGLKAGAKVAAKTTGKAAMKASYAGAAVGSLWNVSDGVGKWKEGDKEGAAMEFGSAALPWAGAAAGAAIGAGFFGIGAIPGAAIGLVAGSIASIGADIAIGKRDITKAINKERESIEEGIDEITKNQKDEIKKSRIGSSVNDSPNVTHTITTGLKNQKLYAQKEDYYDKTEAEFEKLRKQRKNKDRSYKDVWKEAAEKTGYSQYHDFMTWHPGDPLINKKGTLLATAANNQGSSIGSSVGNSTSIGAGQTYSASSAGGSKLGDAFFGIHDTISEHGGFGKRQGGNHRGIDLPYPEGTTVRAFLPGQVVWASYGNKANDNNGGFGNVVGIKDDISGMVNIYAHLQSINVGKKRVKRGDPIGKSGHTGYSVTGGVKGPLKPHLHFEVRPSTSKGGSKDPVAYVASALGYSVDSLPDSGPMFADSSSPSGSARAASEPKGIYNEGEGDVVASAGESGESIEQTLKNAYANNQFDQTGNVQFLSAINSIRVQLGKYQQIGMVI